MRQYRRGLAVAGQVLGLGLALMVATSGPTILVILGRFEQTPTTTIAMFAFAYGWALPALAVGIFMFITWVDVAIGRYTKRTRKHL